MKSHSYILPISIALFLFSASAVAAEKKVECKLRFTLNSWSVFYKSGKGHGNVTCDNGQTAAVKIRTHGGGITFGKSKIVNGYGNFSKVKDISEIFGGYGETEAHAGASGSADAHVMWKGDVSLAISGTGKGWNLGINFGKFKITRR